MADAVDFLRYIYFSRNPDVQVYMFHTPRLIFVFFFCPLALWHSRHASLASMNSEMLDEFFSPSKRGRHNRLVVFKFTEKEIYSLPGEVSWLRSYHLFQEGGQCISRSPGSIIKSDPSVD